MADYYVRSGGNDGGSYFNSSPYASLKALTDAVTLTENDTVYFASDHESATLSATYTVTCPNDSGLRFLSVNRTTRALEIGAHERTNGNYSYVINGALYVYGMTFSAGAGISQGSAVVGLARSNVPVDIQLFDACTFWINSTNSSAHFAIGGSDNTNRHTVKLQDCAFTFIADVGTIRIYGASYVDMQDCILSSAVTTLFPVQTSRGMPNLLMNTGCDYSLATNLFDVTLADDPFVVAMVGCLVPSTLVTGTHPGPGSINLNLQGCGTATDDFAYGFYNNDGTGVVQQNTSVYLTTGGASFKDTDGATVPMSLSLTPSTHARYVTPLYTPWFNVEITATGSKTFSVKTAHTEAAVLKDNELWLEVEYMGNAAHPQLTNVTTASDIIAAGSNLTDTTEAWTGITSEKTHTLSKTVTVSQQGWARARVALAKQTTNAVYVDPQVTVS
jgi:hypothetical protein